MHRLSPTLPGTSRCRSTSWASSVGCSSFDHPASLSQWRAEELGTGAPYRCFSSSEVSSPGFEPALPPPEAGRSQATWKSSPWPTRSTPLSGTQSTSTAPLSSRRCRAVPGEQPDRLRWRGVPIKSIIRRQSTTLRARGILARVVVGLTMTPAAFHAGTGTPT